MHVFFNKKLKILAPEVGLKNKQTKKSCSYQNTCDAAGRISNGIASIELFRLTLFSAARSKAPRPS